MLFLRLPGYLASSAPASHVLRAASCLSQLTLGTPPAHQLSCHDIAQSVSCKKLSSLTYATRPAAEVTRARSTVNAARPTHDFNSSAARCSKDAASSGTTHRAFAAIAAPDSQVDIFDRALKQKQRDRAARLQHADDPVLEAVAEGLVGRLDDCKRQFPKAAVIGGAGENVVRRLGGGRAGISEVLLLDASSGMLQRAQRLQQEAAAAGSPWPKTQFIQADDEHLPLQEHSLDVIICPLGLHWINDLPGALTQCRLALKPDGLLLGAMLGGDSCQELRIACSLAEQELEGGVSSRISPLAQVRDAGNLLTRAGLNIPAVDVDDIVVQYSHPIRLVAHLRAMGESNAVRKQTRALRRVTAMLAAEKYQAMFGEPDGSVPATFQVIYLTGWSPHASQQRPLQRGSAQVSFQDLEKAVREKEQSPSQPPQR